MAEFMACRGEFKDWAGREGERDEVVQELLRIARKNTHKGFATSTLLDVWREANEIYQLKECHCTPYGLCGFFTMDKTIRYLLRRKEKFAARFFFEDGDKHKGDFISLINQLVKRRPKLLAGLKPNFEKKSATPFQAADLRCGSTSI